MEKLYINKIFNPIISPFRVANKSIFITGHGRSGTTWIGNTFKQAPGVLYYGEPCNPKVAKNGNYSHWFRYVHSDGTDPYFESCLDPAFKGLITAGSTWIMQPYRRFLPGARVVIKEVASLLLLEWVYKRYQPDILLVFRHPCAVALSEKNKNTPVDDPIEEILKQEDLVNNHLSPYLSVLEKAKKPFEIYGALWGARNRVITDLNQKYPEWKVLFYEDLCDDPNKCFHELFDHFNLKWTEKVDRYVNRSTSKVKPGTFSPFRVTKNQTNKWKNKMTNDEIEQVRKFVEPFNLPYYNKESDWSL